MDHSAAAAEQFKLGGEISTIQALGNGNINDTFLVTLDAGDERHFVLQRINTYVFRHPDRVMRNIRTFTEHMGERLEREPPAGGRRWEVPRVLPTGEDRDHWIDPDGSFWRAISFIERTRSFDTVQDLSHAEEVGHALGTFHRLLSDLPIVRLLDTLEGFHITPRYLHHYDSVRVRGDAGKRSPEVGYCLSFVDERRAWAGVLEDAKTRGSLLLRPIHGDPKVNNVLLDSQTGQAVSIIDLDTVKPGLVHYDLGDCLRSCCNPLGEETENWEDVRFQPDLCRAILKGYAPQGKAFLSGVDYPYFYEAVRLIAFELGLRFFTDYLEGNIYFKARHAEHNLKRALVQFKLVESIEAHAPSIRSIIGDMQ